MHTYDRNGTKHRSATDGEILFGVGWIALLVILLCVGSLIADHFGI